MLSQIRRSPLPLCLMAGLGIFANLAVAQPQRGLAGADVQIRNVSFNLVRPPGGGDAWLETVVELAITANPVAGPYARYADRVQVTLNVGIRTRDNDYGFYRASAEAVSLEAGRAAIRFYLPPEILEREQVNTDPYAYLVELAIGGRPLPMGPGNASASLRSPEVLRSFKDRVAQDGPRHDGILVPQYESPFVSSYPSDTPSFVRRPR